MAEGTALVGALVFISTIAHAADFAGSVQGAGSPVAGSTVTLYAAGNGVPTQLAQGKTDDNGAFNLDASELSDLINKKSSNTKVILLGNQTKDGINPPGVIYVTKETNSSELIYIIKRIAAASSYTV